MLLTATAYTPQHTRNHVGRKDLRELRLFQAFRTETRQDSGQQETQRPHRPQRNADPFTDIVTSVQDYLRGFVCSLRSAVGAFHAEDRPTGCLGSVCPVPSLGCGSRFTCMDIRSDCWFPRFYRTLLSAFGAFSFSLSYPFCIFACLDALGLDWIDSRLVESASEFSVSAPPCVCETACNMPTLGLPFGRGRGR